MPSTANQVMTMTQPTGYATYEQELISSVAISDGSEDGSKYVVTDANGKIDPSLLPANIATVSLSVSVYNNHSLQEIGSSVSSVTVSWSASLPLTSQTLNGTSIPVNQTSYTYNYSPALTTDTTYTLEAYSGSDHASASTTVAFEPYVYYGTSPTSTVTTSQILSMTTNFATNHNLSTVFNCSGGAYPVYAFPASFGAPNNVTVGGLAFTSYTLTTQSLTNEVGYTQDYMVLVFIYQQSGANITFTLN